MAKFSAIFVVLKLSLQNRACKPRPYKLQTEPSEGSLVIHDCHNLIKNRFKIA